MNAVATVASVTDVHARDRSMPAADALGDARSMPVDIRRQAARIVALTTLHWLDRGEDGCDSGATTAAVTGADSRTR